MGVKIKHTDPTLNSFSTDDLVVNVSEGSLFFKSKEVKLSDGIKNLKRKLQIH